jgi:hypothetical protein
MSVIVDNVRRPPRTWSEALELITSLGMAVFLGPHI